MIFMITHDQNVMDFQISLIMTIMTICVPSLQLPDNSNSFLVVNDFSLRAPSVLLRASVVTCICYQALVRLVS